MDAPQGPQQTKSLIVSISILAFLSWDEYQKILLKCFVPVTQSGDFSQNSTMHRTASLTSGLTFSQLTKI